LISEGNLNFTALVRASKEFSWWNHIKARYCRTGNLKMARNSANRIYKIFLDYKEKEDFVGMDMARKFLQMGYTRSRRYANHKSGRKYAASNKELLPRDTDEEKAESAKIFLHKWKKAREDEKYLRLKNRHRKLYEKERRELRGIIK
jgi:hypothetical protein